VLALALYILYDNLRELFRPSNGGSPKRGPRRTPPAGS
jgi:hypothetical protein